MSTKLERHILQFIALHPNQTGIDVLNHFCSGPTELEVKDALWKLRESGQIKEWPNGGLEAI